MSELRELYQQLIVDHSKRPRNFGALEGANRRAVGHNPLCGDKLILNLIVDNGIIRDARFEGEGCAISTASASLMTEAIKGKTKSEAEALFKTFQDLVTGDPLAERSTEGLGKLAVFAGVAEFPMRVKCATLAWHTLGSALAGSNEQVVSTEKGDF